ncbi:ankyrin repeat domain-containing protein [Streptomyces coelicoflavus]|uniref:ankyrin repeat domain-containing protein n=1 Tax=Streptomyces coelicoflavus TaxID=285562 RepID=UPI00324B4F1F
MNRRKHKKLSRRLADAALVGDLSRVRAALRAALRAGAPAETADPAGSTPLYLASVNGDADIVRVLLAAGARPDTESGIRSEGTPLCGAACWGHVEAVRVLLEHGADPNLREDHGTGWTPLEWASHGSHQETVDLLVAAGGPGTGRRREPCAVQHRC